VRQLSCLVLRQGPDQRLDQLNGSRSTADPSEAKTPRCQRVPRGPVLSVSADLACHQGNMKKIIITMSSRLRDASLCLGSTSVASSQAGVQQPVPGQQNWHRPASELSTRGRQHPAGDRIARNDRQPCRILTDNGYRFRFPAFGPWPIVLNRRPGPRGRTVAHGVH
jgi:hypothetical protein